MPNDYHARIERLEKARQAKRHFIDNPPPIIVVTYIASDGDGRPAPEQPEEENYVVDPMPAILAKARRQKSGHRG